MKLMFKPGDRVKLKDLDTLRGYFVLGRRCLSGYDIGSTIPKTIDENWYTPIEQDYDQLATIKYRVLGHMLHYIMDMCVDVATGNGRVHRYPEGWLEKA